jgi:hypothetical protein
MQRTLLGFLGCLGLLVGCEGESATPSGGGGGSGEGGSETPAAGGGGENGTGGTGQGGEGGEAPGLPCAEGPIDAACDCGGESFATGSCCSEQWFDPYYETLIDGCPAPSAFRYVDPAHAAADDTGPGTADAPWATIQHGVATAAAGQILIVREGTYQVEGTGIRYEPALNPQSGAAGAPVIIKADGNVIIEPAAVSQGTAQGGTLQTIVLSSSEPSEDNAYVNHHVRITAGTGAGQARQILRDVEDLSAISYEGATKTVWVNLDASGMGNWETAPDATSQYELVRNGPLVGTSSRQHVVWDGFHVRERDSYSPDTGPVVIWASDNVVFLNNDVESNVEHLYDNHNIIRVEGSTASVIRNNYLHGLGMPVDTGPNNPQNHAAIMIYGSHDLVIEHNEIDDAYTGIFPKGESGSGHTIRNNVIHGCAKAMRFSFHSGLRVHQNAVYDCESAFQFAENIADVAVFNNVVHGGVMGLNNWFPIAGASAYNNIFFDVESPAHFEGGVGTLVSNRNVFFGFASFVPGDTLAGWQALGYDADAVNADPQLVDVANRDYRLEAGSPALGAGRDDADLDGDGDTAETIPAGAYVTGDEIVGRFAEP